MLEWQGEREEDERTVETEEVWVDSSPAELELLEEDLKEEPRMAEEEE